MMDGETIHRNINGGWMRPAVFGAMDGLVSNFALMVGVAGGSQAVGAENTTAIVLAGFAGLLAGAFSMAAGEYTSVASQAELAMAEIEIEKNELRQNPEAEIKELAEVWIKRGVSETVAMQFSKELSNNFEAFADAHTSEEFGVTAGDLPSAKLAAISSFVAFAAGATVPLVPYLLGSTNIVYSMIISLIGLFGAGALVSLVTTRTWWYSGTRQLLIGSGAAAITWFLGTTIGAAL
ncbi:MAG: VIT1/CCC1 transporter family protein [Candidatus Nanopelagicales bacterium]|jgi:VIT1/CCC1 family predicted Fe2+/Mn2+ transporter|nr:VIT1/CCC1 transporter family protein [Candidatus Nanopelagicales bacterium]